MTGMAVASAGSYANNRQLALETRDNHTNTPSLICYDKSQLMAGAKQRCCNDLED